MSSTSISYTHKRNIITSLIYKFYLTNPTSSKIKQDLIDLYPNDFTQEEVESINGIFDNIKDYEQLISDNLAKSWKWLRIPNIHKAILIESIYEIKEKKVIKNLVINIALENAAMFLPSVDFSYINAVLDKIY